MYSMTGFGKGEYREGGLCVTVELKSVNNRFLDLAVKCPARARALRRGRARSPSLPLFARPYRRLREHDGPEGKAKTPRVDFALAEGYQKAAKALSERFPEAENDVSLAFLLRLPDVVRFEERAISE